MQRNITTLPLPQHIRFKLNKAGFTTIEDLSKITASELCSECELTREEALEVLELIIAKDSDAEKIIPISGLELLSDEISHPPIPTFCQAVDNILGGGIPLKKVTELCGIPGAGKTQMCLQLCINVQLPNECGGMDSEAIFIDTEGSFSVDRLHMMANAAVKTCHKILKSVNNVDLCHSFNTEKILKGIYYFHCKSHIELVAIVKTLPEFLSQNTKVRLIIVDSICFHFRYGFEGTYILRNRFLNQLSQSFIHVAKEFNLAVLVTNQMTTQIRDNQPSVIIPALGKSWGHICTIRMILSYDENRRQATVLKSPFKENDSAYYEITVNGIRDCLATKRAVANPSSPMNAQDAKTSKVIVMETMQPSKKHKIDGMES